MFKTDADEIVIRKIKNICVPVKIALISSTFFCVIIHSYFFMNKFVNEDSAEMLYRSLKYGYSSGRWFLFVIQAFRTVYNAPHVVGILTILYLVIANALIVSLLEVKSAAFAVSISLLLSAFPALAYSFSYDFMADAYTSSFLLSIMAIFFTKKYKHGYIAGALCLMLSLALYQSYIGSSIGLCLILLVIQLLNNDVPIWRTFQNAIKYIICGTLGALLYICSVKLTVLIYGNPLLNYKGVSSMGVIPLFMIPKLIRRSFIGFFSFFIPGGRYFYVSRFLFFLYVSSALLAACLLISIIVKKKIYSDPLRIVSIVVLLTLIPIGLNAMDILAPEAFTSTINTHQFVYSFVFVIVICEYYLSCVSIIQVHKWIALILTLLIGYNYLLTSGIYYMKTNLYYERTFAFYNRVLSRIEELDSYQRNMPIFIIGKLPSNKFNQPVNEFPVIANDRGLWGQIVGLNSTSISNSYKMRNFIRSFLGVELGPVASQSQINEAILTDEFQLMPIWPAKGSIAVINDIIVFKLNYEYEARIEHIEGPRHQIKNIIPDIPKGYLYAWYILRNGERIDAIWYQPDFSSFEYDFTDGGEYQVIMFVRTERNIPEETFVVGYSNIISYVP